MKALRVKQSLEATDELYSLACGLDNRVHTYMVVLLMEFASIQKIVMIGISPKIVGYVFLGSMIVMRLISMVFDQMSLF